MLKILTVASFALALSVGSALAAGKPCRDDKGHFTKCPVPAAKQVCRNAAGKFAKCGTPGAAPLRAKTAPAGKPAAKATPKP